MGKLSFLLLVLLALVGCSSTSQKPLVVVTIPPYADLTRQIVGDFAEVQVFVPPGANPHIYEPTPRQVAAFAKATLWLRYGDPIEEKVLPFLREHNVKDVDLSEGFFLISSHHCCHQHKEGQDHHLWLDPAIASEQVKKITTALIECWPGERQRFEANCENLSSRLKKLENELSSQLSSLKGTHLLLSHPALGYYCLKYALFQLSVESEGKEPLPQQVAHLVKEAGAKQVKVVLLEPQYSTKGAALIADKLKIPTATIDPYGDDYFQMLHLITDTIVQYHDHQS
jgi:zinc transport system substrate-binding protein